MKTHEEFVAAVRAAIGMHTKHDDEESVLGLLDLRMRELRALREKLIAANEKIEAAELGDETCWLAPKALVWDRMYRGASHSVPPCPGTLDDVLDVLDGMLDRARSAEQRLGATEKRLAAAEQHLHDYREGRVWCDECGAQTRRTTFPPNTIRVQAVGHISAGQAVALAPRPNHAARFIASDEALVERFGEWLAAQGSARG